MSTRERPNKERSSSKQKDEVSSSVPAKTADNIDDWLDSFDPSTARSKKQETQLETESISNDITVLDNPSVSVDSLLSEFVRQLPGWINKPWMYVKPTHDGHLQNWYQSWRDLLLKYTTVFSQHIINLYDLKDIHPFTHQTNGKTLSLEQLQYIVECMIDENLAKWLENDQIRARIYFTTDAEWAEKLYDFMVDQGYALDIMTFFELHNLDQPWSTLPDPELALILDILVQQDKAEWVGKDRDTIQFKVP